MKYKFNGWYANSEFNHSMSGTPEVKNGLILMQAGDVLEIEGLRFIATRDGFYDFPPNEGSYYIEIEPTKKF